VAEVEEGKAEERGGIREMMLLRLTLKGLSTVLGVAGGARS
jgi:hypothetical protein